MPARRQVREPCQPWDSEGTSPAQANDAGPHAIVRMAGRVARKAALCLSSAETPRPASPFARSLTPASGTSSSTSAGSAPTSPPSRGRARRTAPPRTPTRPSGSGSSRSSARLNVRPLRSSSAHGTHHARSSVDVRRLLLHPRPRRRADRRCGSFGGLRRLSRRGVFELPLPPRPPEAAADPLS